MTNDTLPPDNSSSTTRRLIAHRPEAVSDTQLFLPAHPQRRGEGGLRTQGYFKQPFESAEQRLPLLTVITVVYNSAASLERTIRSVLEQPYDNIEYIIIDGGSVDGTLEIIRRYEHAVDYWVSEPDGGIYDAMNKGISCATGDGLLFLNADDYFHGDVIKAPLRIPSLLPVKYHDFFGRLRSVSLRNCRHGMPYCHQGIIFENGTIRYDRAYTLSADYEYYLAHGYCDALPLKPAGDDENYVYYNNYGLSQQQRDRRNDEAGRIIRRHFGLYYYLRYKTVAYAKKIILTLLHYLK